MLSNISTFKSIRKITSKLLPKLHSFVKGTHISCGALVVKVLKNETYVLLLYRDKTNSWHLPKGTRLRKETLEQTAIREVYEETGFEIEIQERLDFLSSHYSSYGKIVEKITLYFLAKPLVRSGMPDHEHDRIEWVKPNRAKKLLSSNILYENEALVIEQFEQNCVNREPLIG